MREPERVWRNIALGAEGGEKKGRGLGERWEGKSSEREKRRGGFLFWENSADWNFLVFVWLNILKDGDAGKNFLRMMEVVFSRLFVAWGLWSGIFRYSVG